MYQPPADYYTDSYRAVGAAAAAPLTTPAADDDLDEFSDEDLLRHLGFGDGAEVADAELLAALDERERAAESEALAQFYRRMRDRFFEDDADGGAAADGQQQQQDDDAAAAEEAADDEDEDDDDDDDVVNDAAAAAAAAAAAEPTAGTKRPLADVSEEPPPEPPAQYRRAAAVDQQPPPQPQQQQALTSMGMPGRRRHTRLIQLDSQTRDPSQALSTSYLFDLSEKVYNVNKLSLYSVSVPYQWYTVGNTFGSNFLYLVGAAPGIDGASGRGARQSRLLVKVPKGNYLLPALLCSAVTAALAKLPGTHPHITLNDTGISLDPATLRATLRLGFQNTFEDPHWAGGVAADAAGAAAFAPPTLAGDANELGARRATSLAAFLGFNRPDYGLSCAYGNAVPDDLQQQQAQRFELPASPASARTVRIVHYLSATAASAKLSAAASVAGAGLPDFDAAASSAQQRLIGAEGAEELRLVLPAGSYTRRSLAAAVNAAMAAEPRLDMAPAFRGGGTTENGGGADSPAVPTAATTYDDGGSGGAPALRQLPLGGSFLALERPVDAQVVDRDGGSGGGGVARHALFGTERYVWSVRLRRRARADPSAPRGKLALLLPDHPAWVGNPLGLNFPRTQLELQTLRAETPLPASDFDVPTGAAIEFWVLAERRVVGNSTNTTPPRNSAFAKDVLAGRAEIAASAAYSLSACLAAINYALANVRAGGTEANPDAAQTGGNPSTDGTFARAHFPVGTNWAAVDSAAVENPPFVLSVDYTRDYGRKHFTFQCGAGHVFNAVLGLVSPQTASTDPDDGDLELTSVGGAFPTQQSYSVDPDAVLFQLGVHATGETAGLRPTAGVFPAVTDDSSGGSGSGSIVYAAGEVPFVHLPGRTSRTYTQDELLQRLQQSLADYQDADGARVLINSTLAFLPAAGGQSGAQARFVLRLSKRVTEADLEVRFVVPSNTTPPTPEFEEHASTFWSESLHLGQSTYSLYNPLLWPSGGSSGDQVAVAGTRMVVRGTAAVDADTLLLAEDAHFGCAPAADADPSGDSDSVDAATSGLAGALPAGIVVPAGVTYSRRQLLEHMNARLAEVPELAGSALRVVTDGGAQAYCEVRWSCCRAFGPESYDLLFYSTGLFRRCAAGSSGAPTGATPTGTLGWALGFRDLTTYSPRAANVAPGEEADDDDGVGGDRVTEEEAYDDGGAAAATTVYAGTHNAFAMTADASGRVIADLTGDAAVSVSLVTKLYLTIDEFAQSRANDTVISVAARDSQFSLAPGVSRRSAAQFAATGSSSSSSSSATVMNADPLAAAGFGGGRYGGGGGGGDGGNWRPQTQAAAYASAALLAGMQAEQERQKRSTTTNAAFVPTDTLAVLPVDLAGAQFGDTLTWSGPALVAAMTRSYTAPIRLARGRIQLLTDAGTPLDLNGQNWSATILCDVQPR